MPLVVENILGKKLFTTESKKYNKSQLLLKKKREVGKANKNRMVSFNSSFTDYTFWYRMKQYKVLCYKLNIQCQNDKLIVTK